MKYENRVPDEGINVDVVTRPMREFFVLTGVIAVGAALIVLVLGFSAQYLAKFIPFRYEKELAARFESAGKSKFSKQEAALETIVNKLLPGLDLPADMTVKVHYMDEATVNAFATLGGHVFVFRGLIEKLPSENALAFVLAHEIAHIKHRHPAQALGRGVAIGLAMTAISAGAGGSVADGPLGAAGLLTSLKFTRGHESESDASALQALVQAYGNAAGATEVFALFEEMGRGRENVPDVLLTHPASGTRNTRVRELALANKWPLHGPRVPLSDDLTKVAVQNTKK